jgi:hypothetical protein
MDFNTLLMSLAVASVLTVDEPAKQETRTGLDYSGLGGTVEALFEAYPVVGQRHAEADFAGAYSLWMSGCGSACQFVTLIRLSDGEELRGVTASEGMDWRVDSRLVIANPPAELALYGEVELPDYLRPKCFVLNDDEAFEEIACGF